FLTAGVDVQRDRLECEVVAWGRDKISWSVDYQVLDGDTAQLEVWQKLDMKWLH
ncbi:terminase gpA endonuclease subunit, partial [Thiolapillus sp.]|uniref:terminase gpA endonuclease subunit n=1 Tax=Thiolapillus sp. TaxID=2017437 RepID=UPI003AF6140E